MDHVRVHAGVNCIEVDGSTTCTIQYSSPQSPNPMDGITAIVQRLGLARLNEQLISSHPRTLWPTGWTAQTDNDPWPRWRAASNTTECPSLAASAGGCCSSPGLYRTVLHRLVTVPHDSKKSRKKKGPRATHRQRGALIACLLACLTPECFVTY